MNRPHASRRPQVFAFNAAMFALSLSWSSAIATAATPVRVESPDGSITVELSADEAGRLQIGATRKDQPILLKSAVGIVVNGKDLGAGAVLGEPRLSEINETYRTLGSHAQAVNHCREAIIPVTVAGGTNWVLEVRAYNDGIGYRYRVPGEGKRRVDGESSAWRLPAGSSIAFQQHNARGDYESPWQQAKALDELPQRLAPRPLSTSAAARAATAPARRPAITNMIAAPALFELPSNAGYVLLTDANLVDYTDTALQFVGNDTFRAVFHNDRDGFDASGEIVSSWRAAIIVPDLNALVNSDLVQNLCPPADAKLFADAESWIKPGRATWHWMVTRGPKMELQREWVDLTAALNFEYYMIDDGWNRWRQEGKDAWACLRDVVEYAKTRSVGIWAWVDSKELLDHASRQAFFEKARATGLAGLKVDFMKPADTQWVTWYEETIRQAAEHKLMLNFHGSLRPTGRQRTLPNDLTRESVRGREMGKQAPLHDTILPFTRMVQGPTDYTPVDFRADKLKNSSYAHELSMAVIFTSPFFCYGGSPADYLQSEAAELIKRLPATWDETRVLPGSRVGELAAFARRSGTDWYIGVMNGAEVEGFTIDLGFLGDGSYNAEQFGDVPDRHDAFARTSGTLRAKDEIRANLRRDGGLVVRLTRAGG